MTIDTTPIAAPAALPIDTISTEPPPSRTPPRFDLTFHSSLAPWNKSVLQWGIDNDKHFDGLAVGAHVYDADNRLLLVQRAAHDSMPNRWEAPGGAADATDSTLFEATARELWEETGLVARDLKRIIPEAEGRAPGSVFTNRTGRKILCRFSFEVEVQSCEGVRIDPEEHQDYLWVTEEEARAEKVGEREIPITNQIMRSVILEGFRLRRLAAESKDAVIT
ncbi:hypothetical protein jhhlp_000106 [Lomentospora prolificans]|uniref:Nudix hydrolase domain-containing protein n=1 Tax=Lomentospora prolificans TaxID=41688 RepID=A0A2N3NLK5_9PEZI|nr:hypothetical protein jhhlp_000106 [Lomentospora prolificans]